jgi:hypothetical protein
MTTMQQIATAAKEAQGALEKVRHDVDCAIPEHEPISDNLRMAQDTVARIIALAEEPGLTTGKQVALHQRVLWRGYPGEITKVFIDTHPNYKVELDNGRTIEVDGWELEPIPAASAPMTVDEIADDPRI